MSFCKRKVQLCVYFQIELDGAGWGSDLDTCTEALELHKLTHREIAQFRREVDKCVAEKRTLKGEEQKLYMDYLSKVEVAYAQLNVRESLITTVFAITGRKNKT